jgi:hypothetical protein
MFEHDQLYRQATAALAEQGRRAQTILECA